MKQVITGALFILFLAGCKKESGDNTPPIDPSKQYSINFELTDQTVKTRVTNDTLHLDMYEKLSFLVDPVEYNYSWALHMIEDLSQSYLNNLHYSCLSQLNVYAYDFRSDNLNHVHTTQKSVSDTTINGKKYVKVLLQRTIMFFSVHADNQAAIAKQNELLSAQNQTVTFSSFYVYNDVESVPSKTTAKVVYTK